MDEEEQEQYEYVAVYVDDLAIAMIDSERFVKELKENYGYKLKGIGPLSYHLGCDFLRSKGGTLMYGPRKYIEKTLMAYERMFGEKPREASSPLEKQDHPETDEMDELGEEDIKRYQSLMGSYNG